MNTTGIQASKPLPVTTRNAVFAVGLLAAASWLMSFPLGKGTLIHPMLRRSGLDWRSANNVSDLMFGIATSVCILGAVTYLVGRRSFLRRYELESVRDAFRPLVWVSLGVVSFFGVVVVVGLLGRLAN